MFKTHVLAGLALAVLLAGCGDGDTSDAGSSSEAQRIAQGRQVYQQQCLTCHQADGQGLGGIYPTLRQTRWSEGDKGRLIRLVLHGMDGPVEVKGQTYDTLMQPLSYLTDEEIAAVLTFVRQNFGNDASSVTPEEVAAVRSASSQSGTWAPDTLWQQTGIPGSGK